MAEPKRYAMIDADGTVYNVVMWDGETPWPNDADVLVQSDDAGIGWRFASGKLVPPPPSGDVARQILANKATDAG